MPTIKDVLHEAYARLASVSTSARLDAQLLLAEVLQVSRAHVLAHPERELTSAEAEQIAGWLDRREQGEPVAYILGRRAFYDREFAVTPDVLIPRPETEHLIEAALDFIAGQSLVAVDVGTGSGAIAVTVKANAPQAIVYATDVSTAALQVARMNASTQNTDVTFFEGDLLAPLVERGVNVDLIMANLPYIKTDVLQTLPVRKHEPILALDGGADGLDLAQRCLMQAQAIVNPGALVLLEIGADQGAATCALVEDILSVKRVVLTQDLAGLDRLVWAWLA